MDPSFRSRVALALEVGPLVCSQVVFSEVSVARPVTSEKCWWKLDPPHRTWQTSLRRHRSSEKNIHSFGATSTSLARARVTHSPSPSPPWFVGRPWTQQTQHRVRTPRPAEPSFQFDPWRTAPWRTGVSKCMRSEGKRRRRNEQ